MEVAHLSFKSEFLQMMAEAAIASLKWLSAWLFALPGRHLLWPISPMIEKSLHWLTRPPSVNLIHCPRNHLSNMNGNLRKNAINCRNLEHSSSVVLHTLCAFLLTKFQTSESCYFDQRTAPKSWPPKLPFRRTINRFQSRALFTEQPDCLPGQIMALPFGLTN